jgi:Flp pilus assembly pilin Flp
MKMTKMRKTRQLGQEKTEYIIIVALIAIASIAIYTLSGDVLLRNRTAVTANVGCSGEVGK